MKRSKLWLCALAIALGSVVPGQGFAKDSYNDDPSDSGTTARRTAVRQTSAATNWAQSTAASQVPPAPDAVPDAAANPPADITNNAAAAPLSCDSCNACGDCGHCGSCDSCCDPGYQLIALAEATFFWPQLHRNFLTSTIVNANVAQTIESTSELGSVDGNFIASPRLTLGIQGECWGFVTRYWDANSWANGWVPSDPNLTTNGIVAFDGFRAYTFDLEAQRRFCAGAWEGYGFGGVRYGLTRNFQSMTITNFTATDLSSTSSLTNQQFAGTGITFGFSAFRSIWNDCNCCEGPWQLFVANRYSFLWGNSIADAQTRATVSDLLGSSTSINGALAGTDSSMFIGELQLGLQWNAQLRCLPGRAFIRTAFEYQYWDANADLTAAAVSAAVRTNALAAATASAGDLLYSLVGFNIGAGLMY